MRQISVLRAAAVAGVSTLALFAGGVPPASAANSGSTVTTFIIDGGSLSITVQPTAALTYVRDHHAFAGHLGSVNVRDDRGLLASWTVSAASTPFTEASNTTSTAVVYQPGEVLPGGSVTIAPSIPVVALSTTPTPVVTAFTRGTNVASWNPVLYVGLPPSVTAGTYTGSVTTSIA